MLRVLPVTLSILTVVRVDAVDLEQVLLLISKQVVAAVVVLTTLILDLLMEEVRLYITKELVLRRLLLHQYIQPLLTFNVQLMNTDQEVEVLMVSLVVLVDQGEIMVDKVLHILRELVVVEVVQMLWEVMGQVL